MALTGKNKSKVVLWIASSAFVLVLIVAGVLLVKALSSDCGGRRERRIQTICMIKPVPPSKIPEKPPEPEIKKEIKKEDVVEQKMSVSTGEVRDDKAQSQSPDKGQDQSDDGKPAGADLGLDSDGTAGSDGFGLAARKGGRALIGGGGGGGGNGSLFGQYAWYTYIIQDEIKKTVRECLEKSKGIPKEKLQVVVRIELNKQGKVIRSSIYGSSGNEAVDQAVMDALTLTKVSEPPPDGMPRIMKLRISSRG